MKELFILILAIFLGALQGWYVAFLEWQHFF